MNTFENTRTRLSSSKGQVVVLVAVGMTMLIAIAALVVDLGYAYTAQRNLQSSADAAALAGAEGLPNLDSAVAYAESYGTTGHNSHGNLGSVDEDVTTTCVEAPSAPGCVDDAVVVHEIAHPTTFFGRLLGVRVFSLNVKSVACRDPVSSKVVLVDKSYSGLACAAPGASAALGVETSTNPSSTTSTPTSTIVNDAPAQTDTLPLTSTTATINNPPPYTTTAATTTTSTVPSLPPPVTTTTATPPATTTAPTTTTTPAISSPTITTRLSATPITVGESVFDTATLGHVSGDAGGTVTFTVFSDSGCTQSPLTAGVKTVSHGVVPQSNSLTFNNAGTFYWEARYSGDAANAPALSPCTSEVLTAYGACVLGYPDISHQPQSSIDFNESAVLKAYAPSMAGPGDTIKVWYSDEHALTLGTRQVVVKTSRTSSTSTNYPLTPMTGNPSTTFGPSVGATAAEGGIDTSGRPMYPALFVTDITGNPASRAGDWQQGLGNGVPPNAVFGTWKGAVETIDKSVTPAKITVTPDADPAHNSKWDLGPGSDAPPSGTGSEGYSAEARWSVDSLGLQRGHAYRLQFMVHDGDQNQSGGDSGEACMTVVLPS